MCASFASCFNGYSPCSPSDQLVVADLVLREEPDDEEDEDEDDGDGKKGDDDDREDDGYSE